MEKTCGNCGHGCYESTVYCEVTNDDMLVSCKACDDWIEATNTLEQRYQQLAEVARSLYELSNSLMNQVSEVACQEDLTKRLGAAIGSVTGAGHVLNRAAEQLEELGVEL